MSKTMQLQDLFTITKDARPVFTERPGQSTELYTCSQKRALKSSMH